MGSIMMASDFPACIPCHKNLEKKICDDNKNLEINLGCFLNYYFPIF